MVLLQSRTDKESLLPVTGIGKGIAAIELFEILIVSCCAISSRAAGLELFLWVVTGETSSGEKQKGKIKHVNYFQRTTFSPADKRKKLARK